MTCVSNYFKANVCGCLSVFAHVCFYLGLCLSVAAMSVFNGVCGNNHLIVRLPPFEKCVCMCVCLCVCLSDIFHCKNKLKAAEMQRGIKEEEKRKGKRKQGSTHIERKTCTLYFSL